MSLNKKNKPLYKKILKLRYPISNVNKLNRLKKSKWSNFVLQLKRAGRRRKKFILQDHLMYSNSNYLSRYNRKFKSNLSLKQKFNVYYGNLLEKYLKSVVRLSLRKNSRDFSYKPSSFMVEILEQRLDVILVRSFFANSIANARQLILHGHIYVNGRKQTNLRYPLKKGDLIELSKLSKYDIETNILNSNLWPLPPEHLEINYNTLQIKFVNKPQINNMWSHYSFFMNFNQIIAYYSH